MRAIIAGFLIVLTCATIACGSNSDDGIVLENGNTLHGQEAVSWCLRFHPLDEVQAKLSTDEKECASEVKSVTGKDPYAEISREYRKIFDPAAGMTCKTVNGVQECTAKK